MTAVEFIQKFGWEKARESMSHVVWCETAYCIRLGHGCFKSASDCCVDINDLKRYVDAWGLVQNYINKESGQWFFIADYCKKNRISPFDSTNYEKAKSIYLQAIALVEEVVTK